MFLLNTIQVKAAASTSQRTLVDQPGLRLEAPSLSPTPLLAPPSSKEVILLRYTIRRSAFGGKTARHESSLCKAGRGSMGSGALPQAEPGADTPGILFVCCKSSSVTLSAPPAGCWYCLYCSASLPRSPPENDRFNKVPMEIGADSATVDMPWANGPTIPILAAAAGHKRSHLQRAKAAHGAAKR